MIVLTKRNDASKIDHASFSNVVPHSYAFVFNIYYL